MPYADKEKQAEYHKAYYEKNKTKISERKARWIAKNPDKRQKYSARQNSRYKADPQKYSTYFRNRYVIRTYGVTSEWYEKKFAEQGGVCAICGAQPDIERHGITRLAIDHDHDTGTVRGLLCNRCNAGMGIIGDSVKHLEDAAAYLKKWQHE
jgi:hypothetical protein